MNNFDLYNIIHIAANKDVFSNWFSPESFELELIKGNLRQMRNRLGLPERYQPGTMQAGASASRIIEIDLLPFLVTKEESLTEQETNISGWYYINDFYTSTSLIAEIISQQEVGDRLRHPNLKPTVKYPVAMIIGKGLKVWPDTITGINISYYRLPATPSFNTQVNETTGELEYVSTSVELEWDDNNKLDILHMMMQDVGVNIEKQDLEQLAQKLVESGK